MRKILNIIARTLVDAYDIYSILHLKVFGLFFTIIAIFAVGVTFNYLGLMVVNGCLGIIFIIAATYIASQPKVITGLIGIGTGTELKEPINGITDAFKLWAIILSQIMIWVSIFFLICATVHFDRNIDAMPVIVLGLFIIFMAAPTWGFKSNIPKRLAYIYAIVMVIVYFSCMISPVSYKHYIKFDPVRIFRVSDVDIVLAEIEDIEEEQADENIEKELKEIKSKIKKREKLSDNEEKFLQNEKKERDNRSVVTKTSNASIGIFNTFKGLLGLDEHTDEEKRAIEDGYYAQADKIDIPDTADVTPKERQEAIARLSKKVDLLTKACQHNTGRYEVEYQFWRERLGFERALVKYETMWGPAKKVELTESDKWIETGLIKPGDRIKYLSNAEFLFKYEKGNGKFKSAITEPYGARFSSGDMVGDQTPVWFSRLKQKTTVYSWIIKNG